MTSMRRKRILFVDDDPEMRSVVQEYFDQEGYLLSVADDGKAGLAMLSELQFDAIVTDLRMKEMDGLSFLKEIRQQDALTPVVLITAFGTIEAAVEAIKEGATNFIPKPFKMVALKTILDKAIEHKSILEENKLLKAELTERYSFHNLLGKSKEMQKVYQLIRQVAGSHSNVLIQGESGTGKELVAKAIHHNSARSQSPFVAINCSAVPETLLESELFGYVKGAFTDAKSTKQGLFETASGGTLFLDEISSMPVSLQAKLLRVLQDSEIRPLGSTVSRKVDVRIICATNQDLEELIEQGTFREDLFYRLNVITIPLPALRDRREDIPILAQHFLKQYADQNKKAIKGFDQAGMSYLMNAAWKGNVRELENAIERAVVLSNSNMITSPELLPVSKKTRKFEFGENLVTLQEIEDRYIEKVLNAVEGNVEKAARILGVSARTLYRRGKSGNHKKEE
jgi:DNA-binding NtrC family response regulator